MAPPDRIGKGPGPTADLVSEGQARAVGETIDRRRGELDFRTSSDDRTGEEVLEVPLAGAALLDNPIFNKGSAFPEDERPRLGV